MTRALFTTAAIVATVLVGAAQGMPQNSNSTRPVGADPVTKGPTISERDIVKVVVLGEAKERFSGNFTVDLDGSIEYPVLGRITVKGMTTEQVRDDLTKRLKAQLVDPQVMVEVEKIKNKSVFVNGEVRTVGEVAYAGSITVREALIRSSGVTEQAGSEATIIRAGSGQNVTVDIVGLMAGDPSVPNLTLQENDTINVPKAKPVFIQGPVNSPGPYIVRPGTTVQQLVTMAGGITEKGKEKGIKIQRASTDPKKKDPKTIEVKDWKTEVVIPGDVVIVPKRVF